MSIFLEIEEYILKLAEELYHDPQFKLEDFEIRPSSCLKNCDDIFEEVERREYLLSQDAKIILEHLCDINGDYTILFRQTGTYSLQRMKQGHPCKGHEIIDKTIKPKNNRWTYCADEKVLERLCGLVGYPDNRQECEVPLLGGVWFLDDEGCCVKKPVNMALENTRGAFSGDYDIGDLFVGTKRVFSSTKLEKTSINMINTLLRKEPSDMEMLSTPVENWRCFDHSFSEKLDLANCSWLNPYSPIRHGAQSSYSSYLMRGGRNEYDRMVGLCKTDFIKKINKEVSPISLPMCAFHSGKIYEFKNIKDLFNFYEHLNVVKQIPFSNYINNIKSTIESSSDGNINDDERIITINGFERELMDCSLKFKDMTRSQILNMIFDTEPIRDEFLQE